MRSQFACSFFVLFFLIGCNNDYRHVDGQNQTIETTSGKKILKADQLIEILKNDDGHQIVDVRTPEEYAESHIEGAVNFNIYDDDFSSKIATLDRQKPVYVYCKSGKRSGKAAKILIDEGFDEVFDLKGGFDGWPADKDKQ